MGRAHSNALTQVAHFFDLPRVPVMQLAAAWQLKARSLDLTQKSACASSITSGRVPQV